jgi:hypothetical protein
MPILLAAALLVSACYTGSGADRMAAILDELAFPNGWELVKTEVRAPDGDIHCQPGAGVADCPSVIRRYLVDAAPADVFAEAKPMVEAAVLRHRLGGEPRMRWQTQRCGMRALQQHRSDPRRGLHLQPGL